MRKYIPIVITAITWSCVLRDMIILARDFQPNMMYDLTGAALIAFALLSFGVSVLNGIITGICLKKEKDIMIPAIIHGIFTVIIALYAISFPKEIDIYIILYVFAYLVIGGVTGSIMVGIAFFVKVLRTYLSKIKVRKKKEPLYKSDYPPHHF